MKGIIFNLAEEVVTNAYGEEVWDTLLDTTGLDGAWTSLGSYPDEDLMALVKAAAGALGTTDDVVLRQVGEGAVPLLAERYPQFFAGHSTTRSFLLTLNDIIHAEVRKLYPGAEVPVFSFDTSDDQVLKVRYYSPRRLCALAEGFIAGAATVFKEAASVDQPACMHRGDEACQLHCRFRPLDTVTAGGADGSEPAH